MFGKYKAKIHSLSFLIKDCDVLKILNILVPMHM